MPAIARLGELLTSEEAGRIAADLRQRRRPNLAAKKAYRVNQVEVKVLLRELVGSDADVDCAVAALEGIAAVPRVARPDIVWTNPRDVPGAEGRTTKAALDLINRAEGSVYAATYSASWGSPHLVALRNALKRGVDVTVVVDTAQRRDTAEMISDMLAGAQIWTLEQPANDTYAVQHAKLITVDDREALVTSANFSKAAAERSLECGLLSTDIAISTGLRERLELLHQYGVLVDLD
ncbi:DISARM system phospholipase D-like protein DrmC [Amycolatopsis sp. DG1A-15b]|uniref:DISARM system phospholipase D-like protein DrmC n=1 Tax=Amycolatopsis sp. DG1A-15b TaxID=3052846 RepID=UPI00255C1918|nr:DISARM system phospholipase D-like protein DrmC [Amycolatopsis sp. DG1A-15b]WIX85853.1 DISARM system phospholipase D-like protein DrmC [Amycolatopsis sp. DG1A-15b]